MISLIKNELTKIFKKKTIYITFLVVLAFIIFSNCMTKYVTNSYSSYYRYSEETIKSMESTLETLDPNKASDNTMYIGIKSELDTAKLTNKYPENSWQIQIVYNKISPLINEKNTYEYGVNKDEVKAQEIQTQIDELQQKLDSDDWKYFANEDLKTAETTLENLKEQRNNTEDKQLIKDLEIQIKQAEISKEVAEYRINQEIKYGNDYLNQALEAYQSYSITVAELEQNLDSLTYNEKQQYNQSLKYVEENRYILENKVDINKSDDLRGILENFMNQYSLFIIVIVVMIAGTIVSEEFNKGTIKLLLIKPYSRKKILLAKFLTTLIIIVFTIVTILVMQLIVGGIMFGFDSLSIPMVEYNFNTNAIQEINVFAYLGLQILTQLPIIILLGTLAFALSTIFNNSALAITISLLGFMSASIINQIAITFNVQILKYFVTMNWDLSQYLFGALPMMPNMTMLSSIVICIIYFLIMMIVAFIVFKKKNIKNI